MRANGVPLCSWSRKEPLSCRATGNHKSTRWVRYLTSCHFHSSRFYLWCCVPSRAWSMLLRSPDLHTLAWCLHPTIAKHSLSRLCRYPNHPSWRKMHNWNCEPRKWPTFSRDLVSALSKDRLRHPQLPQSKDHSQCYRFLELYSQISSIICWARLRTKKGQYTPWVQ